MSEEENWRSHADKGRYLDCANEIQEIKTQPQMDADLRR